MIKKLEFKNMEVVANTPYFKLIKTSETKRSNLKPLVLINGQIEHRIQAVETATQITKPWCYQYSGYYLYDDEIHTPYIFLYDYPILGVDRSKIDLNIFTNGLLQEFQNLGLSDVDIIGESTGGMIGTLASKNERVDRVVALHSPIYGTPLLQFEKFLPYQKDMTLTEKAFFAIVKRVVDENFGYMQNNKVGFSDIEKVGDISKIVFTTSDIIATPSQNQIANFVAQTAFKYLDIPTDGVIIFDQERMKKDGLNYVVEDGVSHLDIANYHYTEPYYKKYLAKTR